MVDEVNEQQKHLIQCYKTCFATEPGKAVLADLRKIGGLDGTRLLPGHPFDVNQLIYDEARRGLVLGILNRIAFDLEAPDQTTAITQENE